MNRSGLGRGPSIGLKVSTIRQLLEVRLRLPKPQRIRRHRGPGQRRRRAAVVLADADADDGSGKRREIGRWTVEVEATTPEPLNGFLHVFHPVDPGTAKVETELVTGPGLGGVLRCGVVRSERSHEADCRSQRVN
jgi:hypothetical protein